MIRRHNSTRRQAVAAVEVAVIAPLMILLVLITLDLLSGIYRYHQVATLARVGARFAAVHAGQFAQEQSKPVIASDVLKNTILHPMSVGLKLDDLVCTVTWLPDGNSYPVTVVSSSGQVKQNMVRVTVQYPWRSFVLLRMPITLSSTSETTISY